MSSFYSPSSSTSLLYHIYDQIKQPGDYQQTTAAPNQNPNPAFNNTNSSHLPVINNRINTTVLNPANLFGGNSNTNSNPTATMNHQTTTNNSNNNKPHQLINQNLYQQHQSASSQVPLTTMQQLQHHAHHQSQPSNEFARQPQQHNYASLSSSQYQSAPQAPQAFAHSNTLHFQHAHPQLHQHQSSFGHEPLTMAANSGATSNPLVDHHHHYFQASNTNGRLINPLTSLNQQHQQHRQLSSSGASSTLSAQSVQQQQHQQLHNHAAHLDYARHLRPANSKSSSNLASVLQNNNTNSNNTLAHLTGFDATGRLVTTIQPPIGHTIKPHLFANNQHATSAQHQRLGVVGSLTGDHSFQWNNKRFDGCKSAKHYLMQYQAPVKMIMLLCLIAFFILACVRFFFLPGANSSISNQQQLQPQLINTNAMLNNQNNVIDPYEVARGFGANQAAPNLPNNNKLMPPQSNSPQVVNYHQLSLQPKLSSNEQSNLQLNSFQAPQPNNHNHPLAPSPKTFTNNHAEPNQPTVNFWTPQVTPAPSSTSTSSTTPSNQLITTTITSQYTNQLQILHEQQLAAKCNKCIQNGGLCRTPDGRCLCPAGFYGPTCSKAIVAIQNDMSAARCQRSQVFSSSLNSSSNQLVDDCGQPIERQCDDKMDNDNDGLVDCADSECCSDKACQESSLCMKSPDPIDVLMGKHSRPPTASFFQRMQFLIEKSSSQYHSNLKDFNDSVSRFSSFDRASVIRGRVTYMKKGIIGVRVSVAGHTNLGMTLSRDGGFFDLMVNGGGAVLIEFRREPFATLEKAVRVPWNEIVLVDSIELSLDNSTGGASASAGSQASTSTLNQDQEQSTCFAHNYQLMRPQIVSAPRSSSSNKLNKPTSPSSKQQQAATRSSTLVLKESAHSPQEPILLPGSQFNSKLQDQYTQNSTSVYLIHIASRANDFMSTINLQLLPPTSQHFKLPDELKLIHLKIVIEGNLFEQSFEPNYNLTYSYAWNRRNVYRQKCYGLSNALVSVGYEYFDCQHVIWSSKQIQLQAFDLSISDIGQQWNLNIHHRYNYRDSILQRGDGQNFNLKTDKPKIVAPLIGDSYQRQLLCPYCDGATSSSEQRLLKPQSLLSAPDGSIYLGDFNLIRRIEPLSQSAAAASNLAAIASGSQTPERLVRTVLEFPANRVPSKYSMALNLTDPSKLYVSDYDHHLIYAINVHSSSKSINNNREQQDSSFDQHQTPSTNSSWEDQLLPVVGTGLKCEPDDASNCGDGQVARLARLVEPRAMAFDLSGRMYIADGRNVRMVDLDGKIYTILGDYNSQSNDNRHLESDQLLCLGEAIPTHKFAPREPLDLAISPIDDTLHILDNNVVYRLTQDKRIQIIAGRLSHCKHNSHPHHQQHVFSSGQVPVGEATAIFLQAAQSIAFAQNGDLYISEEDAERSIARVLIVSPEENTIKLHAGVAPAQSDSAQINTKSAAMTPNMDTLHQHTTTDLAQMRNALPRLSNSLSSSAAQLSGSFSSRATEYKLNSVSAICVDQQGKLIIADRVQLRLLSIEPDLPSLNQAGEYELQSPDNQDELLVFNRYGHHVGTKQDHASSSSSINSQTSSRPTQNTNMNNNGYKYTFTYSVNSPFGQLTSVQYASGNKISIYRGIDHVVKMIETAFGGRFDVIFS